jgi:hypothetical protein
MLRYDDLSNDLGPLWSHQSCPDCISLRADMIFGKDNSKAESMVRRRALKSFGYFSSVYPHCFPQPKEERTGIFRSFLFSLSFVFSFSAIGSGATPGGGAAGRGGSVESVSRLSSFGTCFRNWVPRAMRWPSSRGRIWSWSASHRPYRGADREEVDEHGGLCSAKNPPQRPKGEARARQIGRSRGERARGRDGTATCGAVNEALSYCVTETPLS